MQKPLALAALLLCLTVGQTQAEDAPVIKALKAYLDCGGGYGSLVAHILPTEAASDIALAMRFDCRDYLTEVDKAVRALPPQQRSAMSDDFIKDRFDERVISDVIHARLDAAQKKLRSPQ